MSNTTAGPLTPTGQHGPFTQSIDVYGLEILGLGVAGGQPSVQGEFLKKVAQTYKLLLEENAIGIDKFARARALDGLSSYNVIQRVGVGSYDSYYPTLDSGTYPGWDYINDNYNAIDFIWHIRGSDGNYSPSGRDQATEVLEHSLHTLSQYALPAAFPEELNVYSQNGTYNGITGELISAYEEAVLNGVYDPSDYAGRDDGSDSYGQLLLREYLYCLIYAEWGYIQDLTKDGSLSPEWSDAHLTAESIAKDNPRGHKLYREKISKVIAKPSLDEINSMYQDGDIGLSGYISEADTTTDSVTESITGIASEADTAKTSVPESITGIASEADTAKTSIPESITGIASEADTAKTSIPESITGIASEADTANISVPESITGIASEADTSNTSDPDSITGIESEVAEETTYVYIDAPKKYKKKFANRIKNYNPSTDILEIDADSFDINGPLSFAAAKNKKKAKRKLAKQDIFFLYDQNKGGLYFNENSAQKGFGDGGIIAILKGSPDLSSDNLQFI